MQKLNIVKFFPGQGSLYNGVGRFLSNVNSKYSEYISIIGDITRNIVKEDLSINLDKYFKGELKIKDLDFSTNQILLFMVNILVDDYYKNERIEAHCYIGHSFGEISALTASGYITFSQGVEIVCHRSFVLLHSNVEGGMGILFCSSQKAQSLIGITERDDVFVANENSTEQTVISGTTEGLNIIEDVCKKLSVSYLPLKDSKFPFHSPLLKLASKEFESRIAHIIPKKSNTKVYSPINQNNYDFDIQTLSETIASHFVLPVKFIQSINHLKSLGYNTFIEIGSQKALTGLVARTLGQSDSYLYLQSTIYGKDEIQTIKDSVSKLASATTTSISSSLLGSLSSVSNEELFKNTMIHFMELSSRVAKNETKIFDSKPFEELLFSNNLSQSDNESKKSSEVVKSEPEVATENIYNKGNLQKDSETVISTETTYKVINKDTIEEEVFQLVQDLTEYPREVLDHDAEFEADLGIDSVKQWGILSRLQERFDVKDLFDDKDPAEYNTIGKIVSILQ